MKPILLLLIIFLLAFTGTSKDEKYWIGQVDIEVKDNNFNNVLVIKAMTRSDAKIIFNRYVRYWLNKKDGKIVADTYYITELNDDIIVDKNYNP